MKQVALPGVWVWGFYLIGVRLYAGWGRPDLAHGCAMYVVALEALDAAAWEKGTQDHG